MVEMVIKTKKKPKQARARARVEAILEATRGLVQALPADEITTTAIARAADIPVGSVYQYFEDRTDILAQLYDQAFKEVTAEVDTYLKTAQKPDNFEKLFRSQTLYFWQIARTHPTFRPLTRWANSQFSFNEVTPNEDGTVYKMIANTFTTCGINLPAGRETITLETATLIVSVMVDAAIEQQDEDKATAIIEELVTVLSRYITLIGDTP